MNGLSRYDFSAEHTRLSVERSLERLQTDYLDLVLVHCPSSDLDVVRDSPVLGTLRQLKEGGLLRSYGVSHSTVEAGLLALELSEAVMTP